MSSTPLEREWIPFAPCPCGCPVQSAKLSTRTGHVRGCSCRPCLGRRSKRKGRAAQARGYRALGGSAPFTPGHEENQGVLSVEVAVESKAGHQVPRSLLKFARSEWSRRAWSQAERSIPAAMQAHPAIYCEDEGWALLVALVKRGRG